MEKQSHSESNDIIEEDLSSSTTATSTSTPVLEAIPNPNSDYNKFSRSRSRRPTLAMIDPSIPIDTRRNSTDESIEPAHEEKWTVKRVFRVTWAYVTTVKVLIHNS